MIEHTTARAAIGGDPGLGDLQGCCGEMERQEGLISLRQPDILWGNDETMNDDPLITTRRFPLRPWLCDPGSLLVCHLSVKRPHRILL